MPASPAPRPGARPAASRTEIRRWRQYLADERAEAAVYRDLAARRSGEEREILLSLAEAERRHETHWETLLGEQIGAPHHGSRRTRILAWLARRFGSVFVLALVQRAESRSPYESDADATAAMAADERIHEEVVRGLAMHGRNRLAGTFRAAVFGANDGLVSNLALVLGVSASGASNQSVLFTGLAGLLAGALSMGAGEYVSVRSQRELLTASTPDPQTRSALPHLDIEANELALVYRARGMSVEEAQRRAGHVLAGQQLYVSPDPTTPIGALDEYEVIGTGFRAALSSFCFFASGALMPVLPFILGIQGVAAVATACVLVGLSLLTTGAIVGWLSGGSPLSRALRQLLIGYGAAAVTYALGLIVGTRLD